MIATLMACNVNVFTDFNVSIRTKNGKSAITPGVQSVGCKPIHPYVPHSSITPQHNISKILKGRVLRMMKIACLRGYNFGFCGAGKKQVLVKLVRTDVGVNSSKMIA